MRESDVRKFRSDLHAILFRLSEGADANSILKLKELKRRLEKLYRKGLVKINHSVMELVCSRYLVMKGYHIQLEYPLGQFLVCDVMASKGDGTMIVEIGTGYTSPEHALDPDTYNRARLVSKIARYSSYANRFALATPPHNILQIPHSLGKLPRDRMEDDIVSLKALCDRYYSRPPVSLEQIRNAHVHAVYILNVDRGTVLEMDPEAYQGFVERIPYLT